MMQQLYFDYATTVVLLVILLSLHFRSMMRGRVNRFFVFLVLSSLVTTLVHIFYYRFSYTNILSLPAKYILAGIYHTLRCIIYMWFVSYIVELTDMRHKISNTFIISLMHIPILVTLGIVFTTPFLKYAYYYGEDGYYVAGPYADLFFCCNILYALYALYIIVKFKKSLGLRRSISLASCAVFLMISYFIQERASYIQIDMFATAASILFIMIFIQNPEDRIEMVSGLNSSNAYNNDLNLANINEKPIYIIQICITNFAQIKEMISFDQLATLIKLMSSRIMYAVHKANVKGEQYYLKNGQLRIIYDQSQEHKTGKLAKELLELFNSEILVGDMEILFETTVCITRCPNDFSKADDVLKFEKSDIIAANKGKIINTIEHITNDDYRLKANLDAIIERGLSNDKFLVYYQPIYSVKDKQFRSAEALVRLIDDEFGFVRPDRFISTAEKNGSIVRIGLMVFEKVCRFIASDDFKRLGLEYIEVNLSVIQLLQKTFASDIFEIMDRYGVRPDQINLEITESIEIDGQKTFVENVKQITDKGIEFSLDDYGTGYSNMFMISALPLSIIKFDKTFVDAADNEKMSVIIENSVNMIKALGKKIVIEGIETMEMLKKFTELECDYIQGYYFSKPIPEEDFVDFIAGRNSTYEKKDVLLQTKTL